MNTWLLYASALVVCAISMIGRPQAAFADAVDFDIAAKPLAGALAEFAAKTNVQVLYSGELTRGLNTAGVSGRYEPEEALKILLKDSGLNYRFTDANTITLERGTIVPPPAPLPQSAVPSSTDGVKAEAPAKPVKVPEILVKDVRERDADTKSYVTDEASTAMRTDTPIRDTPQSIQVITRKVIEEQQAFRLNGVLQNVSGINVVSPITRPFDNMIIRGFQVNVNNFFRNGLFDPNALGPASDTYNMQRIEVLKGPASVLYGMGDPAGIINVVTLKPLPDARYAGNVTLGNFNFYRSTIDATGPLNTDKSVLYRLNVAGQKANSFVDYVNRDLLAIAPSVTWLMSQRTALTVEADYLRSWATNFQGVPAQGSVLPNINGEIPRNLFTGFGDSEKYNQTSYRVGYDLTHQLNGSWSIRNAYRYSILEREVLFGIPLALNAGNQRTLSRFGTSIGPFGLDHRHYHSMITNLVGHFRLLEMDHTLVTGVELRQDKADAPLTALHAQAPPLDIFAPDYSLPIGPVTGSSLNKWDQKQAGYYLQDQIALLPNLKFMGGFRFDYIHQAVNFGGGDQTSDDTAVSPRLGLVYQPIEPVSLYTSWIRGFLPNSPTSLNLNNQLFAPERSTQYEVGIKTFFLQNRVSATLAWFHLTRENVVVTDPIGFFAVQSGEQRSQGIELDVTASLTDGWNVIASYAYTDAEVTADPNPTLLHRRLGLVPYNKATLWSTYHFQEGLMKGFGIGGGVFGYSNRNASIIGASQLDIPGYVRVDAALYYNRELQPGNWLGAKTVNVALNFRNLLDQRYVEVASNSTTGMFFGEPRTVLATVGLQF